MTHSTNNGAAAVAPAPPGGGRAAPQNSQVGVTVVVPLYNERECAPKLVDSLLRVERALADRFDFEFLLVDDGSRDETVELLRSAVGGRANWRIVEHGVNRGIGAAIQTGLRDAAHDIVVSMDSDGSYDAMLLADLVDLLEPGVDLVTASPYHMAGAVENVPLWRLRLSRLASDMYGAVCRHKLSCYTSCFRAYRRSAAAAIELENEGFVGVAELLCKMLEQGGQVREHPAMLRARVAGHSKMRVMRASLGHLRLMSGILGRRLVRPAKPVARPALASSHAAPVNRGRGDPP